MAGNGRRRRILGNEARVVVFDFEFGFVKTGQVGLGF